MILGALFLSALASIAAAQSMREELFGASSQPAPSYSQPLARAYADPGQTSDPMSFFRSPPPPVASRSGGGPAYCVRLCDGRYFPLQRNSDITPAELCSALCPASQTKIFFGGGIESARAQDGKRYAALDTAFLYRERLVDGCTCNGRTSHGLVALDPVSDPTLRRGDIIATNEGLLTFQGFRSRRGNERAEFTPVDRSRLAGELRERLGKVAVVGQQ
jgi:hypothetical protein